MTMHLDDARTDGNRILHHDGHDVPDHWSDNITGCPVCLAEASAPRTVTKTDAATGSPMPPVQRSDSRTDAVAAKKAEFNRRMASQYVQSGTEPASIATEQTTTRADSSTNPTPTGEKIATAARACAARNAAAYIPSGR